MRSAYVSELQAQVDYLAERGPEIAERIEQRDDRVGDIAREIGLVDRVTELTERLQDRIGTPSDALRDAAMAVPAYLVAFILTIFLLIFGPEMVAAAPRPTPATTAAIDSTAAVQWCGAGDADPGRRGRSCWRPWSAWPCGSERS